MPQTTMETELSGDFEFTETETSRKHDDDSMLMQFTEEASSLKISDSSAVDEWVWLSSLGGYTLSTSSKTPTEFFNSSTADMTLVTPGNNPIRTVHNTPDEYSKEWTLDNENKIRISNYSVASGNARGIMPSINFFCYSWSSYTDTTRNNYGCDILIAVNHKQMKARICFVSFKYVGGGGTDNVKTDPGEQMMIYVALKKFMS